MPFKIKNLPRRLLQMPPLDNIYLKIVHRNLVNATDATFSKSTLQIPALGYIN
jgi:hypothetical protein